MLITPLPGTDRQTLRDTMRQLQMHVTNLRGGAMHGTKFSSYIGWANTAARALRHQ